MQDASLLELLGELIRTPSVLGAGEEIAAVIRATMNRRGFDRVEIDALGNVVGVVEGAERGPTILFDAHLDTVDVVPLEAWSVDPFGGEIREGRVWGRGAADMKGALAAMIEAVSTLDRREIRGRAVVAASVEEERIEGVALAAVCERWRPDLVVIGEASNLDLVCAGRGRAEIVLTAKGRPAHASTPQLGLHAVHRMIEVIAEVERLPRPRHRAVGQGVMCLTDIVSVPYPAHSVVPSACRVTYERRLVPGETRSEVLREIAGACSRAGAADTELEVARTRLETWTGHRIEQEKWLPPWEVPPDDPLVVGALAALGSAGLEPRLGAYRFCTNAAYTAGTAGIPTLGFGPGTEEQAHVVDEFVDIADLAAARRGYVALARHFLR